MSKEGSIFILCYVITCKMNLTLVTVSQGVVKIED